ncbi:unnamed protein product, partial [Medioppia subpectinata]
NSLAINQQLNPAFNGTNWVVLCAGSRTWDNYRHQADVYHAYHVIKSRGIPDSNIIVMHYDDIAYAPENRNPGIVINRPNGPDVYKGVPKDYVGKDHNPSNFLAVLKGDTELSGRGKKVVNSGPNDHIFVYFVSHGFVNLVDFPDTYLYAEELVNELISMHKNNRFAKLVFYMEACYSGSMFDKLLPININVYVTTASLPSEESSLCWYNKEMDTYLCKCNAAWLYDYENKDPTVESLQEQYRYIESVINKSLVRDHQHSQQYGDLSIAKLPVSHFLGDQKPPKPLGIDPVPKDNCDSIPYTSAYVNRKQKQILYAKDIHEKYRYVSELNAVLRGRQYVDNILRDFVNISQFMRNLLVLNLVDD